MCLTLLFTYLIPCVFMCSGVGIAGGSLFACALSCTPGDRQDSIVCADDDVPRVLRRPRIEWPQGISASTPIVKVVCKVRVDTFGVVQDVRVDYSQNPKFTKPAKNLAKQYLFEPKNRNGLKRDFWVVIPIVFKHVKSLDP